MLSFASKKDVIEVIDFCANIYSEWNSSTPLRDITLPVSKVVFENNRGEEITTSDQLPSIAELKINADEQEVLQRLEKTLSDKYRGHFYNGNLMFFTDIQYDVGNKALYTRPIVITYVFMKALKLKEEEGGFSTESSLRQQTFIESGVVAPFVTADKKTFLFQRHKDKGIAPVMGFVEPLEPGIRKEIDYVLPDTAKKEATEEVLGDGTVPLKSRIPLPENPPIRACIIKKVPISESSGKGGKYYMLDWVIPLCLDCTSNDLEKVVQSNCAKDKEEHTEKHWQFPLDYNPEDIVTSFFFTTQKLSHEEYPKDNIYIFPTLEVCRDLIDKGYGDYLRAFWGCLCCGDDHKNTDHSKLTIFGGQSLFFKSSRDMQKLQHTSSRYENKQLSAESTIPLLSSAAS